MKYIVFDTETSCLDMNRVEIWQLSGKVIDVDNKAVARFNYNFRTKEPISYNARVRCKIVQEKIDKYPEFDGNILLDNLLLNDKDVYYIGHNVSYDREVVKSVLTRNYFSAVQMENLYDNNKWIDTLRLAKHIYHDKEVTDCSGTNLISFALEYLFHYLHLYEYDENQTLMFHDARFDVDATWELLKHCAKKLNVNLNDAEELVRISNTPVLLTNFTFGKYKGKSYKEVYNKDKSYFKWLYTQDSMNPESNNFDVDLYYTISKLVGDL